MPYKIPGLADKENEQFISSFVLIPSNEDSLDLSCDVHSKSSYVLHRAFGMLPKTIRIVDLGFNELGQKNAYELMQLFSGLPATVTTILLNYNGLESFPLSKFKEILSSFPHAMFIDLTGNDLSEMGGAKEIGGLLASFPDKRFDLGDSAFANAVSAYQRQEHQSTVIEALNCRDRLFQSPRVQDEIKLLTTTTAPSIKPDRTD